MDKMNFLIVLTLFSIVFTSINCNFNNWNQLIKAIESNKDQVPYPNELIKFLIKNYQNSNISSECKQSLDKTVEGLHNSEDWVYKMFNSWSKFPPTGLLSGTFTDFGDYDQCINIPANDVIGESQYCLLDISIPVPKPIGRHQNFYHSVNVLPEKLKSSGNMSNVFVNLSKSASFFYWIFIKNGFCVPSKCTKTDVLALAKPGINELGLSIKDLHCESRTSLSLDLIQIISL